MHPIYLHIYIPTIPHNSDTKMKTFFALAAEGVVVSFLLLLFVIAIFVLLLLLFICLNKFMSVLLILECSLIVFVGSKLEFSLPKIKVPSLMCTEQLY